MRIYIIDKEQMIEYDQGTGDNLLPEDRAEGFVDYINFTIYDLTNLEHVKEVDGGMVLLTEPYNEKDAPKEVLLEAYGTLDDRHVILEEAGKATPSTDYKKGYDDGAYETEVLLQRQLEDEIAAAFDKGYDEGFAAATMKLDQEDQG